MIIICCYKPEKSVLDLCCISSANIILSNGEK